MLTPVLSGRFRKDVKRAQKRGHDLTKLRDVLVLLTDGKELPVRYSDHPLKGDWQGFRDLHLAPDWLLIYRIDGEDILLARTGSHADLFDG